MLRIAKNDLSSRVVSIIKNDREALKNDKKSNNSLKKVVKQQSNNVISIVPLLKRNADFGGFIA